MAESCYREEMLRMKHILRMDEWAYPDGIRMRRRMRTRTWLGMRVEGDGRRAAIRGGVKGTPSVMQKRGLYSYFVEEKDAFALR